jgi:predicted N-acetyltransferase YhbS
MINIREALAEEAESLSDLALRSKGHWGYSRDFLEACREELVVDSTRVGADDYLCFVAQDGTTAVGFYTLERLSATRYELEALFVEPMRIGSGIGRRLIDHAVGLLSERGAQLLTIQSDPNAAAFYQAAGAQRVGMRESASVAGRELPLFEIAIPAA